MMARYLNLEYIWIDCICILQDDKADWEREATSMAAVYSNSYLTMAAAGAVHCGAGMLAHRPSGPTVSFVFEDKDGPHDMVVQYIDRSSYRMSVYEVGQVFTLVTSSLTDLTERTATHTWLGSSRTPPIPPCITVWSRSNRMALSSSHWS